MLYFDINKCTVYADTFLRIMFFPYQEYMLFISILLLNYYDFIGGLAPG